MASDVAAAPLAPVTVSSSTLASSSSPPSSVNKEVASTIQDKRESKVHRKHPLQNEWTLWFFKNDRTKSWEENQREVVSFTTVEDFWSVINHIESASNLPAGCDYSLFKKGIRPMWEDARNKNGGRWLCTFQKSQRFRDLDPAWLEVLMCLIGEAFGDDGDEICGTVINIRPRADKIAVWTGNSSNKDALMAVGHKLKERMNLGSDMTLIFESHADTAVKSSSTAKSLYTI